jgi:hypothetical protein
VVPFNQTIGEFLVIEAPQGVYQKNHEAQSWQLMGPSNPPPTYDFPGLKGVLTQQYNGIPAVYDNTTCKNRCCKLGLVDRSNAADWRVATDFDHNVAHPLCTKSNDNSQCTAWVPCEEALDIESVVMIPLFICISIALFMIVRLEEENIPETVLILLYGIGMIGTIFSVVSACKFIHWAQTTDVDPQYISFQGCVAECNAKTFPPSAVLDRFCAETTTPPWAIWTEDFNPLLSLRSSCPDTYCSQCGSKTDELDRMLRLAWFLRVRSYICWTLLFFIIVNPGITMWIVSAVVCCTLWIVNAVFLSMTMDSWGGRNQMLKPLFPLYEIGCVCVSADVVVFCWLTFAMCWLEPPKCITYSVVPIESNDPAITTIRPDDLVRENSVIIGPIVRNDSENINPSHGS